ncbi:DUF4160 domain-containing protein [Clostridiaceae bacterium 68-1-5]|uniref:DUF4160 domain-containing protein n=1 Tax=Suipraeoptans intestinalis TaxID=2606628 RepID=A0A6N7UTN1_9FIRM|nr:DUF4160 domain-containing protein [Suipraeoptans intestinalis]MSR94474.1 DUF4160 domain-containing protein [Suipraeoptans intestinalis]
METEGNFLFRKTGVFLRCYDLNLKMTECRQLQKVMVEWRKEEMPIISMFAGMKIYMNWNEHNPPHIHIFAQEGEALIDLRTGDLLEGILKGRRQRLVKRWVCLHQEELLQMWNAQEFIRIEPLG